MFLKCGHYGVHLFIDLLNILKITLNVENASEAISKVETST